jgi:hypothetical protein
MTSTARRAAPLLVTALLVLGSFAPLLAPPVRADEHYTMETLARYAVRPNAGVIDVRVAIDFTNTTPDPEGRFSVFDEIKIAVHDEAADLAAEDDAGQLEVSMAIEDDVNVATVELRDGLRYEDRVEVVVTWTLPDTDDPRLRVRPSVVVFPAWGFGTSSEVRVQIPDGYEVRADGDPLSAEDDVLVSGPIEDPSRWLALVTAVQPVDYANFDSNVPLAGGTADLRVRAFADDEAWGERTSALLSRALPLIEEEVALPYPRIGQLIVTETVSTAASGFGEPADAGTEISVAFDQPPFTALHQLTHVWLSPAFIEARWLREGLTSHVAARVADELDVELPYDPAERAADLADAAFTLDAWSADAGPEGEAYGYAASWAFVSDLEATVGPEAIRTVLARVAAGIGPYQSADVEPDPLPDGVATPASALTTRSFLDHLETVSGQDVGEAFAATVLTEGDAALLAERAEARAAFADLLDAGGSWPAPDPVHGAMTAWQFADASAQITEAAAWLERRDALLASMEAVGLSAPDRLKQAYRTYGGGAEAIDELEAEQAVVDAYADAATGVNAERSFIERIGLIGGPDPSAQLNLASGRFADGDLRGAIEAVAEAQRIVASAETGGVVRIASAIVVAILILVLAVLLVRRRTTYTAPR